MAPRAVEVTSGFLIVKRFEALYASFARDAKFDRAIYAVPVVGTGSDRVSVKYRGLDREALEPYAKGLLAEARMLELNGDGIDGTEGFLRTYTEALDVLSWADEEMPRTYEILWTKVTSSAAEPPAEFVRLGFEPTYFTGDHFSAICDCMCFPRWHGTDPEGQLFLRYFQQLNADGLFDHPALASEFLDYYRSFDWTETGDYEIAEVWAAS